MSRDTQASRYSCTVCGIFVPLRGAGYCGKRCKQKAEAISKATYKAESVYLGAYGIDMAQQYITKRYPEANKELIRTVDDYAAPKYALIPVTPFDQARGSPAYRIIAVRNIPSLGISFGALGGYVTGHHNLSHKMDCWIADDAWVTEYASVHHFAKVCQTARVSGHAEISGEAIVGQEALVTDRSLVCDHAVVRGKAKMYDQTQALGHSSLADEVVLRDKAVVHDVHLWGDTLVDSNTVLNANQVKESGAQEYRNLMHDDLLDWTLPNVLHSKRCTSNTKSGKQCMNTVQVGSRNCAAGHPQKQPAVPTTRLR